MLKEILYTVERNKNKIIKFFILCSAVKFIFSLLYRMYSNQESWAQFESTINIYSILMIVLILLQEFVPFLVFNLITENIKIISHYRGKGILFILIALVYTSPTMDDQQNYSAYFLLIVGAFLLFVNREENSKNKSNNPSITTQEINTNVSKSRENGMGRSSHISNQAPNAYLAVNIIREEETTSKKTMNPYDIPDDF